jgi:hypothetical protein
MHVLGDLGFMIQETLLKAYSEGCGAKYVAPNLLSGRIEESATGGPIADRTAAAAKEAKSAVPTAAAAPAVSGSSGSPRKRGGAYPRGTRGTHKYSSGGYRGARGGGRGNPSYFTKNSKSDFPNSHRGGHGTSS